MGKRTFIVADWFAFGIVPIALLYGLYFQANKYLKKTMRVFAQSSLFLLYNLGQEYERKTLCLDGR